MRELSTRRDLRVWRQNVGVAVPLTAAVKRALAHTDYRVVHFSIPGAADLTGILGNGKRLEIECKTATGRQSEQQIAFGNMITKQGGIYVVARCVEDLGELQ